MINLEPIWQHRRNGHFGSITLDCYLPCSWLCQFGIVMPDR
jgi:hypothetical protein